MLKVRQASHFPKFKKKIQLNYHQPPFAKRGERPPRSSGSAAAVTVFHGLLEVQQGPLSESAHFSLQEGSNLNVTKPAFNTQKFLRRFLAWGLGG